MKKISLILSAAMMLALVSCQEAEFAPTTEGSPQEVDFAPTSEVARQEADAVVDEIGENAEAQDVQYGNVEVSWGTYEDAESLVKRFDYIVTGKITEISFRVLDGTTGLPLREDWREYYKEYYGGELEPWRVAKLDTFYDVEVLTAYKGEPSKTIQMKVKGGLKDYRAEEQMKLLKEYGVDFIILCEDYPKLEIGETYLLAMNQSETSWAILGNPMQCLFDLRESLETVSDCVKSPPPERGISARDIISVFGEEEWRAFEAQWATAQ